MRAMIRAVHDGGALTTMVRAPLLAVSLALSGLSVVGCGQASTKLILDVRTSGARSPASDLEHRFTPALWRFYRESGRQPGVANVIDRAEQTILARCMRRAGFDYYPVPLEPVGGAVLDGLSSSPDGDAPPEASMLAIERSGGFGIYARVRAQEPRGALENSQYVASLGSNEQRRYFDALYGDRRSTIRVTFPDGSVDSGPAGGCLGWSSDQVYGSVARDDFRLNAVVDVEQLVEHQVSEQPAMTAATHRWSRCFENQTGHRFASQDDLLGWLTQQYGTPSPTTARGLEIRYSMLSTRCMYQTGAEARYAATTWNVLSHMPAAWYDTLVEVRRWNAQALRTANAVLHRSRPADR